MGQSTDGILFFGVCFDDDEAPWQLAEEGIDYDYDDWLFSLYYQSYERAPRPDKDSNPKAYDEWIQEYITMKDKIPVEINTHCSSDYPMFYLHIREDKAAHVRASCGYPESIHPSHLTVGIEWIGHFLEFWQKLKIKYPDLEIEEQTASWWLVSDWG
jgi:hypothetical protein